MSDSRKRKEARKGYTIGDWEARLGEDGEGFDYWEIGNEKQGVEVGFWGEPEDLDYAKRIADALHRGWVYVEEDEEDD